MKLKRLSLFLALVMILSAFAGTFTFASAAEDANGAWEVNGVTYATLNEAFDARGSATTIYLIKDYTQSGDQVDLRFDGELTIEGKNNATWTGTHESQRLLRINQGQTTKGHLTIKNLNIVSGATGGTMQLDTGKLTLDSVSISAKNYQFGSVILNSTGVQLVVVNSTIKEISDETVTQNANGLIRLNSGAVCSITNSTVDATGAIAGATRTAIYDAGTAESVTLTSVTLKAPAGATAPIDLDTTGAVYFAGTNTVSGGASLALLPAGTVVSANMTATTTTLAYPSAEKTATFVGTTPKPGAPTATTDDEADAAAVELGYKARTVASALEAMADSNGDGLYWDGYVNSFASGYYYLITNYVNSAWTQYTNPIVFDGQNKFTMSNTGTNRILNAKANVTIKNTTINATGSSLLQVDAGGALTLENVTVNYTSSSFGFVLCENTVLNIVNSTINYNVPHNQPLFLGNAPATKGGYAINIINSTITKTATDDASVVTGANNNTGLFATNGSSNNAGYDLVISGSTIDFSKDHKGRVLCNTTAEIVGASSLTLINATIKASASNAPITWYNASNFHMYGENTFVGGDRMVEFAAGGSNSLYYVGNKLTPAVNTLDGAGIRTVKDTSGIRFISTISASVMEGLKSATKMTYTLGTVIMKASDLNGTTVDAAIAAGKQYVDIKAENGIVENEDGSVSIYAALVNIKEKNLGVEFAGIAYIEFTLDNGAVVRVYSDYNEEDNARSIQEVAKKALADVKTTSSNEVVDGFRYNNELAVGETYYVDGEAKVVAEGEKLYSAYNADQRKIIADYLA